MTSEKGISQFRQDPLTGSWSLIALSRGKRPLFISLSSPPPDPKECPFCGPDIPGVIVRKKYVFSIWNKYPALVPDIPEKRIEEGPFLIYQNKGYHEVVILKDHFKALGQLPLSHLKELTELFWERHEALMQDKEIAQVMIFHNWKERAGASVYHPHCQIIATPVVGSTFSESFLKRLRTLYKRWGECPFCYLQKLEMRHKDRLLYENEHFIILSPFAPKTSFELLISVKEHLTSFSEFSSELLESLADALKKGLGSLYRLLQDPPLNFYVHTAPRSLLGSPYFHWHLTILPKISLPAGFELGSNIFISTITPEKAVSLLSKKLPK